MLPDCLCRLRRWPELGTHRAPAPVALHQNERSAAAARERQSKTYPLLADAPREVGGDPPSTPSMRCGCGDPMAGGAEERTPCISRSEIHRGSGRATARYWETTGSHGHEPSGVAGLVDRTAPCPRAAWASPLVVGRCVPPLRYGREGGVRVACVPVGRVETDGCGAARRGDGDRRLVWSGWV